MAVPRQAPPVYRAQGATDDVLAKDPAMAPLTIVECADLHSAAPSISLGLPKVRALLLPHWG